MKVKTKENVKDAVIQNRSVISIMGITVTSVTQSIVQTVGITAWKNIARTKTVKTVSMGMMTDVRKLFCHYTGCQ